MDILDDDGLMDLRPRARGTDPGAVTRELRAGGDALPEANAALQAWVEEGRPAAKQDIPAPEGKCHLCQTRSARYTCRQCGRGSCAEHHWVMFGLCRGCATEDRIMRWHGTARPETDNWLEDSP